MIPAPSDQKNAKVYQCTTRTVCAAQVERDRDADTGAGHTLQSATHRGTVRSHIRSNESAAAESQLAKGALFALSVQVHRRFLDGEQWRLTECRPS